MSLHSLFFIFGFFPIFLITYYRAKDSFKEIIIFFGSCCFYYLCSEEAIYYGILICFLTYISSFLQNWIQSKYKDNKTLNKLCLFSLIILLLLPLLYFKYKNFILSEISTYFDINFNNNYHSNNDLLIIPGISFITFSVISYIIDCYTKKICIQKSPFKLCSYILMFPKVLMGPIVRYSDYHQYENHKEITLNNFSIGFKRFILGFFKKSVIADNLASVVALTNTTDDISQYPISLLWLSSVCFSLQIFFDFSGYSDMAIGIAKMLGFNFKENFNYPYIASSITDFWRRWHISLSFWFRDYVYIPLGGSRQSTIKNIFTLLTVWFLTGLWHGAAHNFIIWGLIFFICILFERYVLHINERCYFIKNTWRICTLLIVNINWVIFNSSSLNVAFNKICSMFGITSADFYSDITYRAISENFIFLILGILLCFPFTNVLIPQKQDTTKTYIVIESLLLLFLLIWGVSYQVLGTHNPFLYQQF